MRRFAFRAIACCAIILICGGAGLYLLGIEGSWDYYTEYNFEVREEVGIGGVSAHVDVNMTTLTRGHYWGIPERKRHGPHQIVLALMDWQRVGHRYQIHEANLVTESGEVIPLKFQPEPGPFEGYGQRSSGHTVLAKDSLRDLFPLGEHLRLTLDITIEARDPDDSDKTREHRETIQFQLDRVFRRQRFWHFIPSV